MSLADELRRLTATLSLHEDGDLVDVSVSLDHPDWMAIDEDEDSELYRWSFAIAVPLVTGELRRAWDEGSHDDANLYDNVPGAATCVPASALPSPLRVHVRGELVFEAGPRVAWDQEIGEGSTALVIVADGPSIDSIVPRPLAASVKTISLASSGVQIVACLPERGLVTRSRTAGYALHTPTGTRALPELDAIVDALPGHETAHPQHRGGPRGRLAIEAQRNHREHIVVVEIDDRGVRQLHASQGSSLTRGGFDASGALLLIRTRERRRIDANTETFGSWTQVLDCDAGQLLDWRGPSADAYGRWQIEGDILAGTSGTTLHLVPRTGVTSNTWIRVDVGSHPKSAWNAASGVAVWTDKHGTAFPQALHCYHPSWGLRSLALPAGGAEPLAVLRDGRIVAAGDSLFLVDPARGEIADLGALGGYLGDLPDVIETDDTATLWTLDPAHWRVELPVK